MKNIKYILALGALIFALAANAQDPNLAFHGGANAYINGDVEKARKIVKDALKFDPSNPKLNALLEKIEEKEKQQQQQQQQRQNQQRQQRQEQKENQSQKEKGEETEEEGEEQQTQEQKPENGKPQDQPNQNQADKSDEQMEGSPQQREEQRISKEKARMILEAMRNNEIQYIQQQRKKTDKRPSDGKPDW